MSASIVPIQLTQSTARHIWLRAQRLDIENPFGDGPQATLLAIEHLGYVQIDTINVIERCHHHILWSRIPGYQRDHLRQAQTIDKTVFEYWTHALSYVPVRDLKFYLRDMREHTRSPSNWFASVSDADLRKVLARIKKTGALTIRDIDDDELVEKDHAWGSKKPSKRALQLAFFIGKVAVSERSGMLKTYELINRHFDWERPPKMASDTEVTEYLLDRALRSQGLVSLDSICHLNAKRKPLVRKAIDVRVRRGTLVPATIDGGEKLAHWLRPEELDDLPQPPSAVHILSPFDPLVIQRKRLSLLFGYDHLFEAYIPKVKRIHGYFGLPVLVDDDIVAVLDLKANREKRELQIQQWTWVGAGKPTLHKKRIQEKLHQFERFQFGT